MSDITPQQQQLADQLKRCLMPIFPKVYMRGIDFSPLSPRTLLDLIHYFVPDVNALHRDAESARSRRYTPRR